MIRYKIIGRKKPGTADGPILYYPVIADVHPVSIDQVAELIESESTVSLADIRAVLTSLEKVVIRTLKDGRSVRLGDIGSFRPTISCAKAKQNAREVTDADIERLRVRFTPGSKMSRSLLRPMLQFELQGKNPADADTDGPGA